MPESRGDSPPHTHTTHNCTPDNCEAGAGEHAPHPTPALLWKPRFTPQDHDRTPLRKRGGGGGFSSHTPTARPESRHKGGGGGSFGKSATCTITPPPPKSQREPPRRRGIPTVTILGARRVPAGQRRLRGRLENPLLHPPASSFSSLVGAGRNGLVPAGGPLCLPARRRLGPARPDSEGAYKRGAPSGGGGGTNRGAVGGGKEGNLAKKENLPEKNPKAGAFLQGAGRILKRNWRGWRRQRGRRWKKTRRRWGATKAAPRSPPWQPGSAEHRRCKEGTQWSFERPWRVTPPGAAGGGGRAGGLLSGPPGPASAASKALVRRGRQLPQGSPRRPRKPSVAPRPAGQKLLCAPHRRGPRSLAAGDEP